MTDQKHFNRVKLANQLPLNQAAKKLLPADWQNPTSLFILNLMWWGLLEGGVKIQGPPYREAVESRLNSLEIREPRRVKQLLVDPEDSGDETINADDLLAMETPEDGAAYLLDALMAYMVATRP